jgi:uncharacterized protein (UPF0248 family)
MIPIHELLNRIRWDKDFGKGSFEIGYFDRSEGNIIVVPFEEVYFKKGDQLSFEVIDPEGETHSVPFHRIKQIYKNGKLIWHREH